MDKKSQLNVKEPVHNAMQIAVLHVFLDTIPKEMSVRDVPTIVNSAMKPLA